MYARITNTIATFGLSFALLACATSDPSDNPAIDTQIIRVTVDNAGEVTEIVGTYDDLVTPLAGDRELPYLADGVQTADPALFLESDVVLVRSSEGGDWLFERDGDAMRAADDGLYEMGVTFSRDGLHSLVYVYDGTVIRATVEGIDDPATLRRWMGGLALSVISGDSPSGTGFEWAQSWWKKVCTTVGSFCAKHWKKVAGGGAAVGVLVVTIQYASFQACIQTVVADCGTQCANSCANSGGCKAVTKSTCTANGLGGASASCEFTCNNPPPNNPPSPLAPTTMSGADAMSFGETVMMTSSVPGTCTYDEIGPMACPDDPTEDCMEVTECCNCEDIEEPEPLPVP